MKIVYHNGKTKIEEKNKKNWYFFVEWEGDSKKFWLNFPYHLLKIIEEKKENDSMKRFTIKAESIIPLKEFLKKNKNKLPYNICMDFLYNIGNQIQTLERFDLGIPFIDIDDIIVVDDKKFLFLNDQKMGDIKLQKIQINNPPKKSLFFSPELKSIKKIPSSISYKCSFYSLASLIVYCYLNTPLESENIENQLKPIYTTKLYWALLRMLEINPEKRYYLII